jgi:hypothetical protein
MNKFQDDDAEGFDKIRCTVTARHPVLQYGSTE